MSLGPRGRQSVAAAAQRSYVLMPLCSSVSRVSGFRTPATATVHQPVSTSTSRQGELLCSSAYFLKIFTPRLGIYTSKPYICPVGHKLFPPVSPPANQHICPPSGIIGHVHHPRAQNCAFFFARRNALAISALRPFQEKFPKISPKFLRQKFGVCVKSPYLCTRKSEMRPTTPHKSEAIRSLKTLHKTIL